MSVYDGPQVDDRLPGFGCTISFGMLGPKRIVLQWSDPPEGWERAANGLVLIHHSDFLADTFASSLWLATADEWQADVSLQCDDPAEGDWRIIAQVYNGLGVLQSVVSKYFRNFQWQFPMINVDDVPAGEFGFGTVWRIAEWQTVTERFPSASFPDEV